MTGRDELEARLAEVEHRFRAVDPGSITPMVVYSDSETGEWYDADGNPVAATDVDPIMVIEQ